MDESGQPAPGPGASRAAARRPAARRCPACGAIVAAAAPWCSLCHHSPEPTGRRARVPESVPASSQDDPPPCAAPTVERRSEPDAELAARQYLAQLAVTESGVRLPAELGFLARADSPGLRLAVAVAGVLVLSLLCLAGLWVAGQLL